MGLIVTGTYLGAKTSGNRSQLTQEESTAKASDKFKSGSPDIGQSDSESRTVTIDVMGGKARVYRDGSLLGETPCQISAHIGETLNLELRREGSEPHSESFSVTAQTRTKIFELQSSESNKSGDEDTP